MKLMNIHMTMQPPTESDLPSNDNDNDDESCSDADAGSGNRNCDTGT